jgi:hypothetical protein
LGRNWKNSAAEAERRDVEHKAALNEIKMGQADLMECNSNILAKTDAMAKSLKKSKNPSFLSVSVAVTPSFHDESSDLSLRRSTRARSTPRRFGFDRKNQS